jgi:hypothetical protein
LVYSGVGEKEKEERPHPLLCEDLLYTVTNQGGLRGVVEEDENALSLPISIPGGAG